MKLKKTDNFLISSHLLSLDWILLRNMGHFLPLDGRLLTHFGFELQDQQRERERTALLINTALFPSHSESHTACAENYFTIINFSLCRMLPQVCDLEWGREIDARGKLIGKQKLLQLQQFLKNMNYTYEMKNNINRIWSTHSSDNTKHIKGIIRGPVFWCYVGMRTTEFGIL